LPKHLSFAQNAQAQFLPRIKHIEQATGMTKADIRVMLNKMPSVLLMHLKHNLQPTTQFLKEQLGMTEEQLRHICCNHPRVLMHSVENSMIPATHYITNEVDPV
jgi:hypothetical protein